MYNDAAILLDLAIADNALFGFKSVEDIQQMQIPADKDEVILVYNEAALDQYILKRCTKAEGVTDAPMPKSAFLAIYQATLKNAGYFCGTSIHTIRRGLGKKVDGRIPILEAPRACHGASSPRSIKIQCFVS